MNLIRYDMMTFEFEMDDRKQVEWVTVDGGITEESVRRFLNRSEVLRRLPVGEKIEGEGSVDGNTYHVKGRVCVELGMDWDDDKWLDFEFQYVI